MAHLTDDPTGNGRDGGVVPDGGVESPEFLTPGELRSGAETPGVDRRSAFETENNVMVQSRVDGDTATDWHHHGDRHVYVYLVEGRVALEYGPDGEQRLEGTAPLFAHIPPGVVHRDVNPADGEQLSVINFVGSGPLVVNVDDPGAADRR